MPKNESGTLWDFQHPFCRKTPKKLKGDPLDFFQKNSLNAEENLKGGPLSLARNCMLRGKRETFLVQFPGPTGTISNFVELLVELFWSFLKDS